MALDALVDSTQLNSDLTDVADAIRAKTGGTAPLAFPNEFISEIGSISGGGVQYVEGTFTLNSDGQMPTITHNLNTEKIAVIIHPDTTIVAHYGYRTHFLVFINVKAIVGNSWGTWIFDYTPYNSTRYPNPIQPTANELDNRLKIATGNSSPWTTQSNWNDGALYNITYSGNTLTNNTFKNDATWCSGTYKYIIYSLE